MAKGNFLKNLGAKVKSAASKTVDLAGRGALYSQMMNDPSANLSMGQRIGGAISKGVIDATLGNMGTLGQALGAGLEARGRRSSSNESPTGGSGVPGSTIPFKQIKGENLVQAINQSTQQMLGGLNTLNATFRMGLNATANQMQAQGSGISALKRDTEDMVIGIREIYELLNKMGYQDKSKGAGSTENTQGSLIQGQNDQPSLLDNILMGLGLGALDAISPGGKKPRGQKPPKGSGPKGRQPRDSKGRFTKKPPAVKLPKTTGSFWKGLLGNIGGKLMTPLAAAYGVWSAYTEITELDQSLSPEDYRKEVARIVGKAVSEFGLTMVGAIMGGAIAGVVSGPGAIVGLIGGAAGGFLADYMLGDSVDSIVDAIVDTLYEGSGDESSNTKPNPNKSRAEAIKNSNVLPKIANEPSITIAPPPNPNKSRAEATQSGAGKPTHYRQGEELSTDEALKIIHTWQAIGGRFADRDELLAYAQRMFPGRKYTNLIRAMDKLEKEMNIGPSSLLPSKTQLASNKITQGMIGGSGEYLASRQKMMDTQKDQTSESALRVKEQEYEQSVKDILQTIRYEARDVLFEADNIKFDASKIEFTEGGAGDSSAIGGGLTHGGGADNWRDGGTESRDGSGIGGGPAATKVPMSEETRKAAEQLQQSGSLTTLPGQDPLASYSDEQLQSLGVTRKEVRGAKGGREYSYTAPPKPKEGEGTFAKGASFEETSPLLMNRLMKDFDLTKEQAAGVIGNLAHESAGLVAGKQEINPVGGGRGGLGWAQWTGPRRKAFEAYLERTGQSADDPEANYGFLKEELMGSEKGAINKLKNASTVEEATVAFEQGYERAGIKHYGPRTDYARRAADLYDPTATGGVPSLTAGLQGMQPANAPQMANVDGKGVGAVNQLQAGKIRGQTLNEKTEAQLRYISQMAGVEMDVISGEQMDLQKAIAMGARKVGKQWVLPDGKVVRTGSTRHDESTGAADVKFKDPATGKYIDITTPEGQAKASEIVKYATQAGMTGFGFGEEYMGRETMHLGGGKEGSWRTTANGGGTVDWIEAAREAGKKEQPVDAVAWVKQQQEKMLAAGKLNVEEASAKNLPSTSPLAMTPEKKARIQQRQRDTAFTQQMNSREGSTPKQTDLSRGGPITKEETAQLDQLFKNDVTAPSGSANYGNKMATQPQKVAAEVQTSQKVSELSKKTTMNRETAPYKQGGAVTQNVVNNNKTVADTMGGNSAHDKNSPNPAITSTMDKYISMYYGGGNQSAFA